MDFKGQIRRVQWGDTSKKKIGIIYGGCKGEKQNSSHRPLT